MSQFDFSAWGRKKRAPIAWLLFNLVVGVAQARPLSPPIVNTNNQHTYILLEMGTWMSSEAEAVSLGGHLATIRSQAEEDWVFQKFGSYDGVQRLLWIGLSDTVKKFHFAWSSGESAAYTRWAPGEPNNVGRGEDYVAIFYPNHDQAGKWNDWNDRTTDPIGLPMNGVVEIIPTNITETARSAAPFASVEINPSITITNINGNVQLNWPVSAANYVLETTTDLAQPFMLFGYSETTNTDVVSVTITNMGPQMFFRLRKP